MHEICIAYMIVAIVVGISGCVGGTNDNGNLIIETSENSTELQVEGIETEINSGNLTYPVYVAAPTTGNKKPGIVLTHSLRGLEPGYIDLVDKMASENYVIIAPKWQTFETSPSDEVIKELINDSIVYLKARPDVDPNLLGLTGFCAGGGIQCYSCLRSKIWIQESHGVFHIPEGQRLNPINLWMPLQGWKTLY